MIQDSSGDPNEQEHVNTLLALPVGLSALKPVSHLPPRLLLGGFVRGSPHKGLWTRHCTEVDVI